MLGDEFEQFLFECRRGEFAAQAGGEDVAAAAELLANFLDIDPAARTHAGAGQAVGHGFEDEGDFDGFDGLQIFDEAFGFVGDGAAAGVQFRG